MTIAASSRAAFCQHEFEDHGLKPGDRAGECRLQSPQGDGARDAFPDSTRGETKLVRATRGAILDIIVDLAPSRPTYLHHISVELNEDNHRALYVPERFAHGYQALADDDGDELSGRGVLQPCPRTSAAARRPSLRDSSGRCRSR